MYYMCYALSDSKSAVLLALTVTGATGPKAVMYSKYLCFTSTVGIPGIHRLHSNISPL